MKIKVQVKPQSKSESVQVNNEGVLVVKVNALPVDGEANKKVIEALAKYYKRPKSTIRLLKGHKSKLKTFELL